MLATAVVVFRESFEVAIVVAILLGACRGEAAHRAWVWRGLVAGVLGAAAIAWLVDAVGERLAGNAQELFGAGVLALTVVMLAWTIVWMRRHGHAIASTTKAVVAEVRAGTRAPITLALAVPAAALRDGAELAVFLYGLSVSQETGIAAMLGGIALGVAGGALVGALLYLGIVALAAGRVFTVVGAALSFLAAGMAAQAVGLLIAGDVLPGWIDPVWDSTGLLDERSLVGQALHALIGYIARPAATQVIVYLAVLAVVLYLALAPRPAANRSAAA